jgi:hypothetical protein
VAAQEPLAAAREDPAPVARAPAWDRAPDRALAPRVARAHGRAPVVLAPARPGPAPWPAAALTLPIALRPVRRPTGPGPAPVAQERAAAAVPAEAQAAEAGLVAIAAGAASKAVKN